MTLTYTDEYLLFKFLVYFQKPKTKKKRFIDPKNERTQTFALIHRSQKDPLAADPDAPQRLLQPMLTKEETNSCCTRESWSEPCRDDRKLTREKLI